MYIRMMGLVSCLFYCMFFSLHTNASINGIQWGLTEWDQATTPWFTVVNYTTYNTDSHYFDSSGNKKKNSPHTNTLANATLFSKNIGTSNPDVGWVFNAIIPMVNINGPSGTSGPNASTNISGMDDPLISTHLMYRPIPELNLGISALLALPVGSEDLTRGGWSETFGVFADGSWENWHAMISTGVIIRQNSHSPGIAKNVDVNTPDSFYANVRLGYWVSPGFAPYVSLDHQTEGKWKAVHGTNPITNDTTFNSGGDEIKRAHETAAGLGMYYAFTQTDWVDVQYKIGVEGKNTTQTNVFALRYQHIF